MNKIIPLFDRSRVVQDWRCERSRYLNYEYEGRGIVPKATPIELFTGISVHDALATIGHLTKADKEVDIDILANTVYAQMYAGLLNDNNILIPEAREFAQEQASLTEGMIRGFYRIVWPRILAKYPRILFVEEEMIYEHDGLKFMSKPDLVVGTDDLSEVAYIEYKSTSSKKDSWVNSWDTAVQLHSTCRAVEATHGVKVDVVHVQGLYKGYESYGKQSSPFCYAYARKGNPPFTKDEVAYDFKAGFKRSPVWEMPGGVKKWVEEMPEVILGDQFPSTPPIYIKDYLVDRFFAQRATREWEIYDAMQEILNDNGHIQKEVILDKVFKQKFDACAPGWGKSCPFLRICHGAVTDPLNEGFMWREAHHVEETERLKTAY